MTVPALETLIQDDPADRAFTVDRAIFTDEELFEREMRLVFENTWVFIGLETQLPQPHSFFTTYIGRQPVLVTRDGAGAVRCFLNSCRHRGTLLCPLRRGRQKYHVCRYHGWSYDSGGANFVMTDAAGGHYSDSFTEAGHDLVPVARLESYRGMLFASLAADVPPLETHLGDARVFLDLVIDQSPAGALEFVPGDVSYTFGGNWKLQFENGLDYYHFASTHSAYVDILIRRDKAGPGYAGGPEDRDEEGQGSFSFDHGHSAMWSIRHQALFARPLLVDPEGLAAVQARVGAVRTKWMLRQRNMTIFPNLQIVDFSSAQLRTWRPLSAGRTEMTSHCLGIVGESAEARRLRIRNYMDFFNPSGLASSDDNVMYEFCHAGYAAQAGPTQGYARGLGSATDAGRRHADELGIAPVESRFGGLDFGDETNFHAGYREWRRLMAREPG